MPWYCELCGHIGGHARNCPNAPEEKPAKLCTKCGGGIYNGEACYIIGDQELCEECINDCKIILDIEPYSYEDYLQDKYEEVRHDAEF